MKRRLLLVLLACICLAGVSFLFRRELVLFARTHKPFNVVYGYIRDRIKPEAPILLPGEVGNNGPATEIVLQYPSSIAQRKNGDLLLSDRGRYIWSIDPGGTARIIAGSGYPGYSRSGTPALEASLRAPEGLCLDEHDNVYFVDAHNHVVQKIDESGRLITIAGDNLPGYGGDSGPATSARLQAPYDVAIDSKGNIYVADYANDRIRKIDTHGIITTFAGTGVRGFSGDGGPASAAELRGPYGVCVDADDNVIIADSENHRIRRVDRDGVIQTIAGTGEMGFRGDGGPATDAAFDTPQALRPTPDGRLFIGDEHNHCFRILEVDGSVSRFIGGVPGFAGDGGDYRDAQLNDPEDILLCPDGRVVLVDGANARVRVISPQGTIETLAGAGNPPPPVTE